MSYSSADKRGNSNFRDAKVSKRFLFHAYNQVRSITYSKVLNNKVEWERENGCAFEDVKN